MSKQCRLKVGLYPTAEKEIVNELPISNNQIMRNEGIKKLFLYFEKILFIYA